MVTVHEWMDRTVHGWIVFTLGPGRLPRRMRRWQTRWREAGSPAAAPPPPAPPPSWKSSAAGRPGRCPQTPRPTCGAQSKLGLSRQAFGVWCHCRRSVTCHCLWTSTPALWALPPCSSCSSSSAWPCRCLISHWALLSSLCWDRVHEWGHILRIIQNCHCKMLRKPAKKTV